MGILDHKFNTYSQNGEDGVISYIFQKLGVTKGNFVDFGAWDGKYLSNCYRLVEGGWGGIYIEGDPSKYQDLVRNFDGMPHITCVNQYVGYDESDNLDHIIQVSGHPNMEFDFISIDVDGLDYNILKAFNQHLPKVICIEVNSGHSPHYDKVIPIEIARHNVGQSLKTISDLASEKGYSPLCYTSNLFLVKNEYLSLFESDLKNLEQIYVDFLSHLDRDSLLYLQQTFIRSNHYNGHEFHNEVLEKFLSSHN